MKHIIIALMATLISTSAYAEPRDTFTGNQGGQRTIVSENYVPLHNDYAYKRQDEYGRTQVNVVVETVRNNKIYVTSIPVLIKNNRVIKVRATNSRRFKRFLKESINKSLQKHNVYETRTILRDQEAIDTRQERRRALRKNKK